MLVGALGTVVDDYILICIWFVAVFLGTASVLSFHVTGKNFGFPNHTRAKKPRCNLTACSVIENGISNALANIVRRG